VAPGPPDDFNNQSTQHDNYCQGGRPAPGAQPPPPPPTLPPPPPPPPEQFEPPEYLDPLDQEAEPPAWYRKPAVLIGWALLVLILIGLIVYGIIELIHGENGTSNTPSTSTSTIPSTTTTPTPPTAATTTTPTTAPPTSSAVEPPPQQPTQQQPTHRHHLPPLPSVITIPEVPTTITLPPGLH
jgi:hypothetical protein